MSGVVAVMAGLSVQTAPTLVIFDFSTPTSGTVTIPVGATNLVVEAWGGGGGGGFGRDDLGSFGGGGGAGGYSKKTLALSGDDGKTILYTAAQPGTGSNTPDPGNTGGTSVVSSGTYILTALQAAGGLGGLSDGTGNQGAGGTATGGDTNTTGAGSTTATIAGAASTAGDGGLTAGGGGTGGVPTFIGDRGETGNPGRVRFVFTV
jgi:hypothetical protein